MIVIIKINIYPQHVHFCVCVWFFKIRSYLENKKCKIITFIYFDICHRMAPLRVLYLVTLTDFFKVKHFNVISETVAVDAKMWIMIFTDFDNCYRMTSLQKLKLQIVMKQFMQTCLHVCGTHRLVAVVICFCVRPTFIFHPSPQSSTLAETYCEDSSERALWNGVKVEGKLFIR